MAKVAMTAKRAFEYGARALRVGQPFEADSMVHALLLERGGQAERVKGEERRAYRRRDMKAEH